MKPHIRALNSSLAKDPATEIGLKKNRRDHNSGDPNGGINNNAGGYLDDIGKIA